MCFPVVGPMARCTRPSTRSRARCWPSNRCRWTRTCRRSSRKSPSCNNVTAPTLSSTMEATSRTQIYGYVTGGAAWEEKITFFHTELWFTASDHDFRWFESDFRCFCEVITGKIIGRNIIYHGCLCGTEFTLVSLYSTEIIRYRSWFLEYKLTWVNSVPHGRGAHDGFSMSLALPWRLTAVFMKLLLCCQTNIKC